MDTPQYPEPLLKGEALPSPPPQHDWNGKQGESAMDHKPQNTTQSLRQVVSHNNMLVGQVNGNELDKLSKENFNLKLRIFYLEERLAKLRKGGDTNESLQQENFELKLMYEEKQQDNEELNTVLVKAQAAVESLQTDLALCRAELHEVQNRSMSVESYRDEIDDKDDQIKQFGAMIRGLESKNQELGMESASLREQLQSMTVERDEAKRISAELRDSLERVTNEMRTHGEQVEYLKDTIASLESDLKDTDHAKTRLRSQDDELRSLRQENREVNKQLSAMTVQFGEQRAKFEQLQQQTSEIARLEKREVERLRQQVNELKDENDTLLRSRAHVEHELESTTKLLQTADETVQELEAQVNSTVHEADEMHRGHQEYVERLEKEHTIVVEKIKAQLEDKVSELRAQLDEQRTTYTRVESDLEHERNARRKAQESLKDQTHQVATLQAQVAKLELLVHQANSDKDREVQQRNDLSESRASLERSHLDQVLDVGRKLLDWEERLVCMLDEIIDGRGRDTEQVPLRSLNSVWQQLLSGKTDSSSNEPNHVAQAISRIRNHVNDLGAHDSEHAKVLVQAQGNWEQKYNALQDQFEEVQDKLAAAQARIGTLSKLLEAERESVVRANGKYQQVVQGQQGLLMQEISDDRTTINAKQREIDALVDQLKEAEEMVERRETELELHKKHTTELEELLHEHLAVANEHEKNMAAVKSQLNKKGIELETYRATSHEAQEELNRLGAAYERLQRELERLSHSDRRQFSQSHVMVKREETQSSKLDVAKHEAIWHDLAIRQDQLAELLHLLASLVDRTRAASQPGSHHPGWSRSLEDLLTRNHKLAVKMNVLGADLQKVYQRFKVIEAIALASAGGLQSAQQHLLKRVSPKDPHWKQSPPRHQYSSRGNPNMTNTQKKLFHSNQSGTDSQATTNRRQGARVSPKSRQQQERRILTQSHSQRKKPTHLDPSYYIETQLPLDKMADTVVKSPTQPPLGERDNDFNQPTRMARHNVVHGQQITSTSSEELQDHISKISHMLEESCRSLRAKNDSFFS